MSQEIIDLQEIKTSLQEIRTALLGIEGQPSTGFIARTDTKLNDHERRISFIETWFWRIAGACALVYGALYIFWKKP